MGKPLTEERIVELAQGAFVLTWDEMHAKIQKEQRDCFCYTDDAHCSLFEKDGAVAWEVFFYRLPGPEKRVGLYVRGERPCGMVQFWDETWVLDPVSEGFWPYLYRRAEKQCGSLDRYRPLVTEVREKKATKQKERQRQSAGWRGRR